jgi:ABC-2 type transport system permease protein
MNYIMIIVGKDIRDKLHNKALFMMLAVAAFVIFMMISSIGGGISTLSSHGLTDEELYRASQSIVSNLCLMMVFMLMLMVSLYMNAYTVLLEKTKRMLESVLCTPVQLEHLWLGKTLATFIPSIALSIILSSVTIIVMNITTIEPEVGRWVLPDAAYLVAILVGLPVVVFLLSSIIVMLQLMMQNIRLIQSIFTALIIGSSFGISYAFRLSTASWVMVYIVLAAAAVLGLAVWLLSKRLTKERIVLSSKGG